MDENRAPKAHIAYHRGLGAYACGNPGDVVRGYRLVKLGCGSRWDPVGVHESVGVDKAEAVGNKSATRVFDTGATRDTVEGKLCYAKALSFRVLRRYVEYLGSHRQLPDGSIRDWDDWKKGIPQEDYKDSMLRHAFDAKLLSDGVPVSDNHGPCNIEDLLCAVMFNAMGWLREILIRKPD